MGQGSNALVSKLSELTDHYLKQYLTISKRLCGGYD